MPTISTLPTAQSGFQKFKVLLPNDLRADSVYERGSETVNFQIRKVGFFWLFHPVIAEGYMWDTSAKIKIYDNNFLSEMKKVAEAFESNDQRRVEIEIWK